MGDFPRIQMSICLGLSVSSRETSAQENDSSHNSNNTFIFWDDVFNILEHIFIAGLYSCFSLLTLHKAPQERTDS